MTKYEWETELKKNIRRLPADEIKRVMEYYSELFEDHIERGKTEVQIINEFGNPVDVADKILSEYDGETTENSRKSENAADEHVPLERSEQNGGRTESSEYKNIEVVTEQIEDGGRTADAAAQTTTKKRGSKVGKVFMYIGFVLLAILSLSFVGYGAYVVIVSFGVMVHNAGSGVVHLSLGLISVAIGIAIALPPCIYCINARAKNVSRADGEVEHENKN